MVRPGLRGRGLGREVTRLVLSWAFEVLGAHRVQLEVLAGNRRAINCYLACGFRREGVRREAELYPDGWKDIVMMGVLCSEYAAHSPPPLPELPARDRLLAFGAFAVRTRSSPRKWRASGRPLGRQPRRTPGRSRLRPGRLRSLR